MRRLLDGVVTRGLPEYNAWQNMRRRCSDPTYHSAHRYSERGIGFDPRWDDFLVFLEDMGYRPSPELTLERVDNDAGYSKVNCVWASKSAQARNRITSKLTLNDVLTMRRVYAGGGSSYVKLAREYGVDHSLITSIIKGRKWREYPVVCRSS